MKASVTKRRCKLLLGYRSHDFSLKNGVEGRERLLAKILAGANINGKNISRIKCGKRM